MPKPKLSVIRYEGRPYHYRPGTTDEKVFREVVVSRAYRKASIGFDVEPGERWLDLGANVGAFAFYCMLRGANADCYEPDAGCHAILLRNAEGCRVVRAAVTHHRSDTVRLWSSSVPGNHYRGTVVGNVGRMKVEPVDVPNVYAGDLDGEYDGVKIDIEGEEGPLIDLGLLPTCHKLCLEYHTSRDQSMDNLSRRLSLLREVYTVLSYPRELDHMMEAGGMRKSFHDRVVFCLNKKAPA